MQLDHVESLLPERKAVEYLRGFRIGMVQQEGPVGSNGEDRVSGTSGLAEDCSCVGRVEGGMDFVDVEKGSRRRAKVFFRERWQTMHDAMGGQNEHSWTVHVNEGHHHELV